jgi:hypothetical protein
MLSLLCIWPTEPVTCSRASGVKIWTRNRQGERVRREMKNKGVRGGGEVESLVTGKLEISPPSQSGQQSVVPML